MKAFCRQVLVNAPLERLASFAQLAPRSRLAMANAVRNSRLIPMRQDLLDDGGSIRHPFMVVYGWAGMVRLFEDGRRQILRILLPGDLFGYCRHDHPVAPCAITALTDMAVCPPPSGDAYPDLDQAYAMSNAHAEADALAQIARLGRMNAHERVSDFLLDLYERLRRCGLIFSGGFAMPLTQEMLADALGLTPVHINRVIQQLRREGQIVWKDGFLKVCNPASLASSIARAPVRVASGAEFANA